MEYLSGSKKEFLDYLSKIKEKDNIAVITHTDLDGVASAILIEEVLKSKNAKINSLKFTDYKQGMFEKLEKEFIKGKINKIFILDVNAETDSEGFENLRKEFDVILIDHHPSDLNGKNIIKTKSADCATFAIYELAKEDFDLEEFIWLVCATMISEYSYKDHPNFEFLKKHYPEIFIEEIYNSQPGEIAKKIASALIYFKEDRKKVFDLVKKKDLKGFDKYQLLIDKEIQSLIKKFKKEAEFFPKQNLYFYYAHPKYSITSITTTILVSQEPSRSFVLVSDIDDEPGFVKISSRSQVETENMNLLMKKGVAGLENATAGGHVAAAGGRFMKKDLQKFKENLLKE
jgi:oligoribonuclease NrnB/cAMP/cGMP phosphodiesterase (DHH superfamily)